MHSSAEFPNRQVLVARIPQGLGQYILPQCSYHEHDRSLWRERDLILRQPKGFFRLNRRYWCAGCGRHLYWGFAETVQERQQLEDFLSACETLAKENILALMKFAEVL